jgi:hypothetical protein
MIEQPQKYKQDNKTTPLMVEIQMNGLLKRIQDD